MALLSYTWWLPLLGVALHFLIRVASLRRRMKGAGRPPGPKGWPLIGNAIELSSQDSFISIFRRWARTYGPIAQFSILGQTLVVLSDDKIAKELFVKRGNKYSNRGAPYAVEYISMNQNPAFRPKDDGWRRQRNLIHSAVSMTSINRYQSLMDDEAAYTLYNLLQAPSSFDDHFMRYSYSVLTSSLLGFSIPSASDPYIHHNEKFTAEVITAFRPDCFPINVFPFLGKLPFWLVPSLKRMESLRKEYMGQMWAFRHKMEKSVKSGLAKESIYKHFSLHREDYAVTDEESIHAFQAMIDGGTRPPHNALLSFIYLMMEFPEWQKRLQKEVDEVLNDGAMPSFKDIPKLPTVRAVVKETIRYRSIMAEVGMLHQLDDDDIYEEYFFEKGTIFYATFASLLMDQEIYPDGKLFNPARWLEPSYPTYKEPLSVYPNCQNFHAFGYGRRSCPGSDFTERSLIIMAAKLAWSVNIHWPLNEQGEEVRESMKYGPGQVPRPIKFGCRIEPRTLERVKILQQAAEKLTMDKQ